MVTRRLVLLSGLRLAGGALAAPASGDEPTAPVPRVSQAYDDIQSLAQYGLLTGYPDGTFQRREALSRLEFAQATRNLLANIDWFEVLDPYRQSIPGRWPSRQANLVRLVDEFLVRDGGDGLAIQEYLKRWDRWWRKRSRPILSAPLFARRYSSPPFQFNEAERAVGARLAAEEWARGEVVLYWYRQPEPFGVSHPYALPWRVIPGAESDPTVLQRITGHNAEIWRLLRQEGAPTGSQLAWTRDLFRLNAVSRATGIGWKLLEDGPYTPFPGSKLSVSCQWDSAEAPVFQKFEPPKRTGFLARGIGWTPPRLSFEYCWGPSGSAIFYLRRRAATPGAAPDLLMAMDIRTSAVLSVEAVEKTGP